MKLANQPMTVASTVRTLPDPAWERRWRHRLPVDEWIARCKAAAAPGEAADHAMHMLHAQLLAEGMAARLREVLGNRRRELLRVLARRGPPR
jgi:hypothetical protein